MGICRRDEGRSRREVPLGRAARAAQVERAREGCTFAFAALYTRLRDRVMHVSFQVIGDRHEAEDAAQEAFLAAFRGLHRLQDPGAFEGWLVRIARNTAVDRARRLSRCRPSPRAHDESADTSPTLPRVVSRSGAGEPSPETLIHLRDELASLSDRVRETIHLRYGRGLSVRKIARVQGVSRSCVKTRLHRARRRIRSALLS